MASNDERIKTTIRLKREVYIALRDYCSDLGGVSHQKIIERAVMLYLTEARLKAAKVLLK